MKQLKQMKQPGETRRQPDRSGAPWSKVTVRGTARRHRGGFVAVALLVAGVGCAGARAGSTEPSPGKTARARPPDPDLVLPLSSSEAPLAPGIDLFVGSRRIELDGKEVGATAAADARSEARITPLLTALEAREKGVGTSATINLHAHRELLFATLWPVMETLALAGYPAFRMVVSNGAASRVIDISLPSCCVVGLRISPAGTAEAGPRMERDDPARVTLVVRITVDAMEVSVNSAVLAAEELEKLAARIPADHRGHDFRSLAERARITHARYPKSDVALFVPDMDVPYWTVVRAVDAVTDDRLLARDGGRFDPGFTRIMISTLVE